MKYLKHLFITFQWYRVDNRAKPLRGVHLHSAYLSLQIPTKINLFPRGRNVKCQVTVLLSALECPAEYSHLPSEYIMAKDGGGLSFRWDAEIKFVISVKPKNSSNLKVTSSDGKCVLWWQRVWSSALVMETTCYKTLKDWGSLSPFLNCVNSCLVHMYSQKKRRKINKLENQFVQWTSWWNSNWFHPTHFASSSQ